MQKLRDLLGLPVLELDTGTRIGEVREVVLDVEMASVLAILIAGTNWFADSQGIMFHNLFSIGRDAVTIRNRDVVQQLDILKNQSCTYQGKDLLNKGIFTETGFNLGALVDIILDATTGEIKAYEISDGIITDLIHGRMLMPLPQAQVVGKDRLIVPDTMAKLLYPEPLVSVL